MNKTELKSIVNDKLCDLVDVLLNYYNPCNICGSGCRVSKENPCCFDTRFGKGKCPFLINDKCVNRNIECKLWICETAIKNTEPECIEALKVLEQFSQIFGLINGQLLGEPYIGADKK